MAPEKDANSTLPENTTAPPPIQKSTRVYTYGIASYQEPGKPLKNIKGLPCLASLAKAARLPELGVEVLLTISFVRGRR